MPPDTTPTAGAGSTGATPTSTGSSPSSGSGSTSSGKTLNIGMGPGGSSSSPSTTTSGQEGRLTGDQLFKDYGEEIFKHDRFKELTGYKQKYAALDPVMNRWQNPQDLVQFEDYLGPVWQSMMGRGTEYANKVWGKLMPVLQAVLDNKDIDSFFGAAQAAAANPNVNPEPDDPIAKELKDLRGKVLSIEEKETLAANQKRADAIQAKKTETFSTYERSAQEWMDRDGIPKNEDTRRTIGDIIASNMWRHMPKGANGFPQNALLFPNSEALQKCYDAHIVPFINQFKQMGADGLIKKVEDGSPAVPSTNDGTTVGAGPTVPPDRKAKAARMAQFIRGST